VVLVRGPEVGAKATDRVMNARECDTKLVNSHLPKSDSFVFRGLFCVPSGPTYQNMVGRRFFTSSLQIPF